MYNYSKNHLADKIDVDDDEALDVLFEELENENLDQYRELRIQEMKIQADELSKMKQNNHGEYTEVEEKDVLDITTNTTYVVVHFFSPTFKRCKIMDEHLEILSKKHYRARFMKTNAEKCAFLVAKLQIKVLPFVMCFVRGVVTERLIGFEKLNNSDTFSTAKLENLLIKSGVITKKVEVKNDSDEERFQKRGIRSSIKAIGLDEEY